MVVESKVYAFTRNEYFLIKEVVGNIIEQYMESCLKQYWGLDTLIDQIGSYVEIYRQYAKQTEEYTLRMLEDQRYALHDLMSIELDNTMEIVSIEGYLKGREIINIMIKLI